MRKDRIWAALILLVACGIVGAGAASSRPAVAKHIDSDSIYTLVDMAGDYAGDVTNA